MPQQTHKQISEKYGPRFGQLAVERGMITEQQLQDALCLQIHEELCGKGHRLLGSILFDQDLMSAAQIDEVLNQLFQATREAEG